MPLGSAEALTQEEPLMVASGGEDGGVSMARMVSRRPFAGYWEYHIEGALFTSPARMDHSGAGLFNARGELMGIGSLFVTDALGPQGPRLPGNMFVPIDLLRPILAELRARGTSAAAGAPGWASTASSKAAQLRVLRVNTDSPAEVAGLRVGDRIVRIDGTEVHGARCAVEGAVGRRPARARGRARHPSRRADANGAAAQRRPHADAQAGEGNLA